MQEKENFKTTIINSLRNKWRYLYSGCYLFKKDNQRTNLEIKSMLPKTKSYLQGRKIKVEENYQKKKDIKDKRNKQILEEQSMA